MKVSYYFQCIVTVVGKKKYYMLTSKLIGENEHL